MNDMAIFFAFLFFMIIGFALAGFALLVQYNNKNLTI